jgi:hypothetical protein
MYVDVMAAQGCLCVVYLMMLSVAQIVTASSGTMIFEQIILKCVERSGRDII